MTYRAPEHLEEFAAGARRFLDAHAQRRPPDSAAASPPETVVIFSHQTIDADPVAELAAARAWRATLADAGYAWIDGPVVYGGAGLTAAHAACFEALQAQYTTASQEIFLVGLRVIGPAMLAYGEPALRKRYLPPLFRGEIMACQLFSEPGAGSDLAGVRTRAERHGDGWVIDGSKVWTSQAGLSDIGLLLARTGAAAARHRGLTLFLVDLQAPGVQIRPLRQMNGSGHFSQVTLNGVRVHDRDRVGDIGAGWLATMRTLARERGAIGNRSVADGELIEQLLDLLRGRPGSTADRSARLEPAMRAVVLAQALASASRRYALTGRDGPYSSVLKLARNRLLAETMTAASLVLGETVVAETGDAGSSKWVRAILTAPGQRIAGGTDEIQRTILAERVLGLPARN